MEVKESLNQKEKIKFYNYVANFKRDFIPQRYNQIKLMDNLLNTEIDHYISISNRSDGKSFNYCHFLLKLSVDYGIGFVFLVRNFTVRQAGQKLFQKIIDTFDHFNPEHFMFMRTDFYIVILYKDKQLGIITDLNQATQLKYQSNYLQDFPIIIYDEFLALEGDYLIDEWDRLKTIYGSIDRNDGVKYLGVPKIIYLGNAVNFSSPILANLDMFSVLESHIMDTVKKYDNVLLELNKNEQANVQRNLRAFKESEDSMTQAEFEVNDYNIATENDRNRINKSPDYTYIKLRNSFLKIIYNTETFETILSVVAYHDSYDFNLLLKDNTDESTYLDYKFYDENHERKYNKDIYLFDNMYSKDNIIDNFSELTFIRINKIIKYHISENTLDNFEKNEKTYKENYIQNTKKALFRKFLE